MDLANKKCIPCGGGIPSLEAVAIQSFMKGIDPAWRLVGEKKIVREFAFKDFKEAMAFVNRVAEIAEKEGHHPDVYIFYNIVRLELWTHAANGLTENDFIIAAKIDQL